jgi:hypothetical protein
MSARKGIVLLLALSTLTLLVGCGSSNNATVTPPPSGSFSASDLNGTYVFSISGTDLDEAPYAVVGAFTANGAGGNGGIKGGTIDINDVEEGVSPQPDLTISGGSYSVGADGRGQMTITTNPANLFGTPLTFDFVLSSTAHGLITEFDGNATGSGTIDAQSAGVTPNGTYAFSFAGANSDGDPSATVGNFTVGSGGSASGLEDFNSGGIAYPDLGLGGAVVLGPSGSPATVLSAGTFDLTYDVYAIDATHLKFIEMDSNGTLSGDAFSQTSSTISGTYAFTLAGDAISGGPFAAGGYMVTDGNGNITDASAEDINENGTTVSTPGQPVTFTATYAAAGSGRYTLNNFSGFIPSTVGETQYAAYPSSGGVLLLELDNLGVAVGAAYPQNATIPTFASAQGYALNLTGSNPNAAEEIEATTVEVDDIAEFTAAVGGSCTTAGAICGIIDENADPGGSADLGEPLYGLALSSGTYGALDNFGRYGFFADAGNSNVSTLNGGFQLTAYAVDGTNFPFIESDSGQIATGVIVLQTPTTPSSAAAKPAVAKSGMFIVRPLIHAHGNFKKRANKSNK